MKKSFRVIPLLMTVLVLGTLSGCKEENVIEGPGLETQERPTDWVVVTEGVDLQSTMIADVVVDLTSLGYTYESASGDLMAAFIDGTCRAVASPMHEVTADGDPIVLFPLTIQRLESDRTDSNVALKFYSARLQHVFSTMSFAYVAEGVMGTFDEPYKPEWVR